MLNINYIYIIYYNKKYKCSPHSVGAGAGQVYGHRTRSRAVVRQEVIKAVEVSGGA